MEESNVTHLSVGKKTSFRRDCDSHALASWQLPWQERRPHLEGIATVDSNHFYLLLSRKEDLIQKGLRHFLFVTLCVYRCRKEDLIQKGLRHFLFVTLCVYRCRKEDLIQKGLRQRLFEKLLRIEKQERRPHLEGIATSLNKLSDKLRVGKKTSFRRDCDKRSIVALMPSL